MTYNFANRMDVFGVSPIREILKLAHDPSVISFAAGNPSPLSFPVKEMEEIMHKLMNEQAVNMLQYGISEGYAPLQEALRNRMRQKYNTGTDDDSIIITSGAQQGIELFAKTMLNEDDTVICEAPSFISALNALRSYNRARLVGIPMDSEGMNLEKLEAALKSEKNVKFIYTISTFQNPTGITTSLQRRKDILSLAKKYNVIILEDNPYFELRYSGEYVPTIKSLDTDGIVAFVGTLSKTIAPGIRIGYLLAPTEVTKKVKLCKQISDVHTNTFFQALSYEFMTNYNYDEHLKSVCDMYRANRDLMEEGLSRISNKVEFTHPEGGLFLWAKMPEGYSTEELSKMLWDEGKVLIVTGQAFSVKKGDFSNCFRLNFSMPNKQQIEKGTSLITSCINKYIS